jgi:hypothetical protein
MATSCNIRVRSCGAIAYPILLLLLLASCNSPPTSDSGDLLLNGRLIAGAGSKPDSWRASPDRASDVFEWRHEKGELPELRIKTNDSYEGYWVQTVNLGTGWYYLTAEVLTGAHYQDTPATLRVGEASVSYTLARRAPTWTRLGLYFKVRGPHDAVEIGCGVADSPGPGIATFRDISLFRIYSVPPLSAHQFDFGQPDARPVSRPDSRVVVETSSSLFKELANFRSAVAGVLLLALLTILDRCLVSTGRSEPAEPASRGGRELRSGATDKSAPDTDRRTTPLGGSDGTWRSVLVALFFALVFVLIWLVTRVEFIPGTGFLVVAPGAVGGDEPHYLIAINRLLFHHDFQLQDEYERVARGGLEAGVRFQGVQLDHHTVVVNRRTGNYAVGINDGELWHRNPAPEFAPSADVYETPAHPVAFSALMALAIAPFRPAATDVEADVGFVLALISFLGPLTTYCLARRIGMERGSAILAALLLVAASPWLAYSRAYFRESTIGVSLILALWALMEDLPLLAALATAGVAILRPPLAFVGACFMIDEVQEGRWQDAIKMALVLGLFGLVFLAFNYWLHKTVTHLGFGSLLHINKPYNAFLDPAHGILTFAPWTLFGFAAIAKSFGSFAPDSRLLRYIALPVALYTVALTACGFGPGYCYGPRYWVPFLPWLAIATMLAMRKAGRPARVACTLLVLFSVAIAVPGALCYPQLFDQSPLAGWRRL